MVIPRQMSQLKTRQRKTVPAYVRVALVPTWTRDADGKEPVGEPASLSDLNIFL
jgi:hypothetical protein